MSKGTDAMQTDNYDEGRLLFFEQEETEERCATFSLISVIAMGWGSFVLGEED